MQTKGGLWLDSTYVQGAGKSRRFKSHTWSNGMKRTRVMPLFARRAGTICRVSGRNRLKFIDTLGSMRASDWWDVAALAFALSFAVVVCAIF